MPASSKEFLHIQATAECGFTVKHARGMIITYSQMHRTNEFSHHSSIIWPVWLNDSLFVYEQSGCGFEFRCSYLTLRYHAGFEQGVPWNLGNYRIWIHSKMCMWHDNNIQSIPFKIKTIEKPHTHTLVHRPMILKLLQEVIKFSHSFRS